MNKTKKKPKKKYSSIGKIQKIEWEDHYSTNGAWCQPDSLPNTPHVNVSVGMVIHENQKSVTLAGSWSPINGLVTDPILLIKGCIVSRKTLK